MMIKITHRDALEEIKELYDGYRELSLQYNIDELDDKGYSEEIIRYLLREWYE